MIDTLCSVCNKVTAYVVMNNHLENGLIETEIITECPICRSQLRRVEKLKEQIEKLRDVARKRLRKLYQPRITECEFACHQYQAGLEVERENLARLISRCNV